MSSSVVEKVRKLMNLAGNTGATEGEIRAAIHQAQRLMERYHLTEGDLEHSPADDRAAVDKAEFNDYRAWVGKRKYGWEIALATFVSRFVGVPYYYSAVESKVRRCGMVELDDDGNPVYGTSFVFYGVADDAALAVHIFNDLRQTIATMARIEYGQIYRGDGGAYCEGFVSGLERQHSDDRSTRTIEASREASAGNSTSLALLRRETDLVAYKQAAAKSWLSKEKGIQLRSRSVSSGANGSLSARSHGMRDGAATSLSRSSTRKLS